MIRFGVLFDLITLRIESRMSERKMCHSNLEGSRLGRIRLPQIITSSLCPLAFYGMVMVRAKAAAIPWT